MRLLALVCSKRRRGNSELIAQIVQKEGERHGASGTLAHLSDYSVAECDGCMRCVFRNERCHLEDDFYNLLEELTQADGLFLVSPTYVLSIPGVLKLVIDRYLLMYPSYQTIWGRPAVSVGVAGLRDWDQFQLPFMNLLLLSLGFRIADSFMAYGAGPGEVLLDSAVVRRVRDGVAKLCVQHGSERAVETYESCVSHQCPVCFSTVFERIGHGKYRCPVCCAIGEEREEGIYFPAESLNSHRFTPERVKAHLEEWILRTKGLFRKRLPDIAKVAKDLGI